MAIDLVNEGYYTCDYSHELIPVPCIASFSKNGGVRPKYIQVMGTDGSRLSLEVGKIHKIIDHHNCDITFTCDIVDGERQKMIKLYFDRKRDRWFLKKSHPSK